MPLSKQQISDICSTLFKLEARQRTAVSKKTHLIAGSSFVPTMEEREEIYRSLSLWSTMDDTAFEAVFFYQPKLERIMKWLLLIEVNSPEQNSSSNNAPTTSSSSSAAGPVSVDNQPTSRKEHMSTLRLVIARCILWSPSSSSSMFNASSQNNNNSNNHTTTTSGGPQQHHHPMLNFDPSLVAERLHELFPSECIASVALLLGKSSPLLGSIVITSWALQNPASVHTLTSYGNLWVSRITVDILSECNALARKGRFERTHSDITNIIQIMRSSVLGVWALIHSCPFLVDFFTPLPKLVASCRIIAEEITPALQHFVFTSDRLAPVRPHLVRIIQKIANAAVDLAATGMVFGSHWSSQHNQSFREFIRTFDRSLTEQMMMMMVSSNTSKGTTATTTTTTTTKNTSFGGGFIANALIRGQQRNPNAGSSSSQQQQQQPQQQQQIKFQSGTSTQKSSVGSVKDTLRFLLPSSSYAVPDEAERLRGFRDALAALDGSASSSTSASSSQSAMKQHQQQHAVYFAEQVLRRIHHQKIKLIADDAPGLVLPNPEKNSNSNKSSTSTAATTTTSSSSPSTTSQLQQQQQIAGGSGGAGSGGGGDPNAASEIEVQYADMLPLVCDILPQLKPVAAARALNYYKGNMEKLIDDAMNGNLPPHLNDAPAAAATTTATAAASPAGAQQHQQLQQPPKSILKKNQSDTTTAASTSSSLLQPAPVEVQDASESMLHLIIGDFDSTQADKTRNKKFVVVDDDDDDDDDAVNVDLDEAAARIMDESGNPPPHHHHADYNTMGGGVGFSTPSGMRLQTTSDDWASLGALPQDLVDKTRELMDRMYTDEFDDAGIADNIPNVRPLNVKKKGTIASDSDDDSDDDEKQDRFGGQRATALAMNDHAENDDEPGEGGVRTAGVKRFGGGASAGEDSQQQPSYARKPKTKQTNWRKTEQRRHQQHSGPKSTKQILKKMHQG